MRLRSSPADVPSSSATTSGSPDADDRASHRAAPTSVRLLESIAVLVFLGYVVWLLASPTAQLARDLWLYTALELLVLGLLGYRVIKAERDRWAWLLLAGGLTAWLVADVVYTVVIAKQDPTPFPAVTDWIYLLFYATTYVCLVLLLVRQSPRPGLRVWLDGLIVALAAGAYAWLAVPSIMAGLDGSTPAAVFMSVANPVSDVLLLCLLVGILGVIGWRADTMWWFLTGAVVLLWVVDMAYLMSIIDEQYAIGSILDAGWLAAFLIIALAPWQRRKHDAAPAAGRRGVVLPTVVCGLAVALLIYASGQTVPVGSVVLAALALLVAAWRAHLAFRAAAVDAEARRQALTDDLTGIGNRRYLTQQLTAALAARREGQRCALLVIDVDSFKEINDALGHHAGDELLRHTAAAISRGLRESDSAARFGGDEFAVVLGPGITPVAAEVVAEQVRNAVARPLQIADLELESEVSVGIALCPDHAVTVPEALRAADVAMYQAKRSHSGIAVYDRKLDRPDRGRVLRRQELRKAITSRELVCEFQPIMNLATGEVTRVETLVRWLHPEHGMLYPDFFLPTGLQTGLMSQLTWGVLDTALAQAAAWRSEGIHIAVSVNLSMVDVDNPALAATVEEALDRYALPGSALNLEVTETALVADPEFQSDTFATIREMGVSLSVDDYGKGYSSLDQLRNLSAGELKLDRSFVTGLTTEPAMIAIVRTTVALARDLGIGLVAEGVESAEDLATLRALGCEAAQGFYICKPRSADVVTHWLTSRSEAPTPALPQTPAVEPE
jgi:diguanylate cyclase (GGDEF)-like protein